MKKTLLFLLLLNGFASYLYAATQEASAVAITTKTSSVQAKVYCPNDSPCAVVSKTSTDVLAAIDNNDSVATIQNLVTPEFDFNLMTRYALGNNWKLATAKQQAELVQLFKQLLIYTYSAAIAKFKGAQVTITSADNHGKIATVKSEILLPNSNNNQPVIIEYNLAKSSTQWKAYDIKIENASLVTTYRNQFNDIIQTSKIDGLIKQLQAKIATLAPNK